jgi:hypothetical protein
VEVDDEKIEAAREWTPPHNVSQVEASSDLLVSTGDL